MNCDNPLMAIDPGISGGFAWFLSGEVHACPMPLGMTAQIDLIRSLSAEGVRRAVLEDVGYHRKGNAASSSAKFARHCGHLESALYAAGIAFHSVRPAVWMKSAGTLPKDKRQRKQAIKERMARLHPHLSVNLNTSDALAILAYARGVGR